MSTPHIHDGDTGGPISEKVVNSKIELNIKKPEISSPNFIKDITAGNEEEVPDIIK